MALLRRFSIYYCKVTKSTALLQTLFSEAVSYSIFRESIRQVFYIFPLSIFKVTICDLERDVIFSDSWFDAWNPDLRLWASFCESELKSFGKLSKFWMRKQGGVSDFH